MLLLPYNSISLVLCRDRFDHGSRQEKCYLLDLVMVDRILTQHFDTEYELTQAVYMYMSTPSHIQR